MRFQISLSLIFLCLSISSATLAQNTAKSISFYDKWPFIQDRQGYIWYAENSGRIGRYLNGDRVAEANIFDEFAGCDYTNLIKEDIEGHIWIATGCRFYRFNPVTEKYEDIQQQILNQTKHDQAHTESWYEDPSGTVWFGGSGLISYTLKTKKIVAHDKDPQGHFLYNIFGGTGHSVWFSGRGTQGFDFTQYDPIKRKIIRSFEFDHRKLQIDGFMSVNVTTEKIFGGQPETYLVYIGGRIFEFDPNAGSLINIPVPVEFGRPLQIGNDGYHNFIGTDSGTVLKYQAAIKNVELVWQHAEKKPVEVIFPASKGRGAYAHIGNNLIPISTSEPLVKSVLEITDTSLQMNLNFNIATIKGRTFLTTQDHLIPLNEKFKSDTITFTPPIENSSNCQYIVAGIPGTNKFWQLIRYFPFVKPHLRTKLLLRDSAGNLLKIFQSPLLDSFGAKTSYKEMVADRCHNVWILSPEGMIMQFNNNTNEFKWIFSKPTTSVMPPRISVDSKCNLWISNSGSGLVRYDKRILTEFHPDKSDSASISSKHVTTAYEATNGHIWVGTKNKGISIMDAITGKFRHLNKKNGLPELIIADIVEDKTGVIWVATLQYLCRWIPIENRFVVYKKEDGIAFNATYVQKVFYPENDGAMMVRTPNEMISFDPRGIHSYQYPVPDLLFTGFSIGNKPIVVGAADSILPRAINFMNQIILTYGQNKFTLKYAAVDLYGNLEYAYRLSGFDDDWQFVKHKTEAIYTNVPPGNYLFEVKAANHQGFWSEPKVLKIKVLPPWYRTLLAYIIYAVLFLYLLRVYLRFRSRKLINENLKLEDKIAKRTNELSDSLRELKETQNQLIQREKMASLGELTAGIAHEIQNPLNFVNNFSEVNKELLVEMREEIDKQNFDEVKVIAEDVIDNEEKINHHGKRADAIVKGMLQHSRTNTGQKEPTDINKLADEYLRLAYHGLRAKDKSFNATLKTNYDQSIGNINVISQDIGRVILNLITNALYAVDEKKKQSDNDYDPTVTVSTSRSPHFRKGFEGEVMITVSDNGNGIPQSIVDKIFQPFFTTKPTGQGTGLGLSLAYDIVKAHGGELKVETKEARPDDPVGRGEGTTFTIQLPIV